MILLFLLAILPSLTCPIGKLPATETHPVCETQGKPPVLKCEPRGFVVCLSPDEMAEGETGK